MQFKKSAYTYILMLGHLCTDLAGGALPAILPFLISENGISYTQAAGLAFALSSVGSAIQPLFGSMADKTSRPWLMSLGILMAGCCIPMIGFIDSYWVMFLVVALGGVGSALFHPDGGRMANYVSGEKKGKGISLFSVGGNIGFALGPVLAVAGITLVGDLRGVAILAILPLIMAVFMFTQQGNLGKYAAEGARKTAAAREHGQQDDWSSFGKLTVVVFLRSVFHTGMTTFIPMFWMSILLQSEEVSGSVASIIAFAGAVATLIGGNLADKYGFTRIIRIGLVLMIPCLIALILSHSVPLCTVLLIPTSMFLFFAFSPCVALGQKFVPNHLGLASGITMGLAPSVGGVFSPILGKVADNTGVSPVMWILVVVGILAAVMSFLVPENGRKKNAPVFDEEHEGVEL